MIQVRNLHKRFDKTKALDGINMTINKASIYGLVGTNGAGKTTIIRHMAGILRQDDGEILFDGEPVFENTGLKQKIGLVPRDCQRTRDRIVSAVQQLDVLRDRAGFDIDGPADA